ncbi:MAG: CpaF family protein, partial [Alphaproteobacteria bacterium]|nr:CpaF family protein [Alphaproteobacteria bacterium]
MFGKRSAPEPAFGKPAPSAREAVNAPPRIQAPANADASPAAPTPLSPLVATSAKQAARVMTDSRSEDYYQIKSTIFNALIDTIDLAQLSQLDPDSAREEIRDIVNE